MTGTPPPTETETPGDTTITYVGMAIFRMQDGKVAEAWMQADANPQGRAFLSMISGICQGRDRD